MLFNRFAMGPLMEEDLGAGGGGAISPELKAALADLIKPMLTEAVNSAVKGKKNEEVRGVKAVEGKLTDLISSLRPKQAKKLMKRLGMEAPAAGKGKSAADIAAEAAAAVAAGKKAPTEDEMRAQAPDFFKKKQVREFELRINALETENASVKETAKNDRKMAAIERSLSDFEWASMESRDMARGFYAPQIEWNSDGELVIGDKPFEKAMQAEISAKYENLLAPTGKGGSGLTKGQGKPGLIDVDALTNMNSSPADKAQAAQHLAALMGQK